MLQNLLDRIDEWLSGRCDEDFDPEYEITRMLIIATVIISVFTIVILQGYFNLTHTIYQVTIALGHREGIALERITVSTYKTCASRAWRVLDGEDFLAFTKGQKTRSFYQNILDPNDPAPVTIDGHMISIFKGKRMRMNEAVRFNKHYELISDAIKLVAYDERLLANQVQAILWFTWKRIHKPVKGDGQLNLYDQQDHWQVMHSPELIEPYPFL